MSGTPESQPADRFDFYAAQYSRFESEVAAEIRREVYGEDMGQQGWRGLDEQALIADLIRKSSPCEVLDIGCGSGGPSLALVQQTKCRLTGVDVEASGVEHARRQTRARGLSDMVTFETVDCNARLPFPDAVFDVVVCIDAVLHLISALWRLSCAAARRRVRHRRGKEVGYVVLQGREPFDLVAQRLPSAVAVNGLVAATVPIYSPRFPSNTADVRILLNPEQAEDLARQLLLEAKNARERL